MVALASSNWDVHLRSHANLNMTRVNAIPIEKLYLTGLTEV